MTPYSSPYIEDPSILSSRDLVVPFGSTVDKELLGARRDVFLRDLVDAGRLRADPISAAKTLAAEFADKSTVLAASLLGAFELMEGTGQIIQLAVQDVLKGKFIAEGFPC